MKRRIGDELRAVLPAECFAVLVERFGGRVIRIPHAGLLEQLARHRRERDALDRGDTYREIAKAEGVAPSTVARDMKRST